MVCVGETQYMWSRGLLQGVACDCGRPVRQCEFWREVGREAFGGWDNVDAERLAGCETSLNRFKALPRLLAPAGAARRALADYENHLEALYDAIFRVSGASVVVETSKHPSFAATLTRISAAADRELRTVHLVRDSRAVAYSWTRAKKLAAPIGDQHYMPRSRPSVSSVRWLRWNLAFHLLRLLEKEAHVRLHYEAFVADPQASLARLGDFAGRNLMPPASRLDGHRVNLRRSHIFSGNPMRARSGWTALKADDRWRTALRPRDRATVTALTWPLLRVYGYSD